jgi:hypothetical protein
MFWVAIGTLQPENSLTIVCQCALRIEPSRAAMKMGGKHTGKGGHAPLERLTSIQKRHHGLSV